MPKRNYSIETYFDSRGRGEISEIPRLFMVEYTVAEGGKFERKKRKLERRQRKE